MNNLVIENGYGIEKESVNLEYKRCENNLPKGFWETYSSFANTFGGTIALGFTESGDGKHLLTGVNNPEKIVKDLWDLLHDSKKVNRNILTEKDVEIFDYGCLHYILVNVHRADRHIRPIFVNGSLENGTYRRNSEGDYHCTVPEILEMGRDSTENAYDGEVLTWTTVEDVNTGTLNRFRNHMRSRNPVHPWLGESDDRLLCLLGAARECDGTLRLTRAGLLMFGNENIICRDISAYHLDYQEYTLDEEWSDRICSDSGLWSGNIFDFYLNVSERVFRYAPHPFRLKKDIREDETETIKVQREAILNSIVHADYMGRCGVMVKLTPDYLMVRNPGSFRIPPQRAVRGGFSDARNPGIMKMFMLAGFVERSGSGIYRIFRFCEREGYPLPDIIEETDPSTVSIKLTFSRRDGNLGDAIMNMIRNNPKISMSEISERSGVSKSTVVREMNELKQQCKVERIGGTKGYWQIK